jgi:hypothetical protein
MKEAMVLSIKVDGIYAQLRLMALLSEVDGLVG